MSLFEASELRDSKCESRSSIVESEKSLLRKSRYLLTKCLSSHNTITQSQVLPCHKQIYVLAWYRPRYQSPWYYIKSVFQYNNEALNFWTHFIPLLHFLYSYYYFYLDVEHSNETFCFPYYAHGLGCCIVLAASSTAHLFASHSEAVCYSCYALDRACIFTYAFSIRVAFEHYLCPMGHFCNWPSSAVTLAIFASYWSLSFAVVLFAETYATTLGRVIMVVTNLIGGFVGFSSCILRYYFDFSPHPEHMSFHIGHDFSNLMAMAGGTFIIGCLIYSFRIPEIFSPGTFDVIGRSHQWMHVFTAASMYAQSAMFRYNIDEIRDKLDSGIILEEDVSVTFGETIGAVIASAILTNSAILLHWAIVRRGDPKRKRV